ncbi:MAG: DUF1592 domain-containing protein [Deltaproteobacteria bacterium]|nr:DUF1592 domain-containing protein [Deltaproteobacteria bacterium]
MRWQPRSRSSLLASSVIATCTTLSGCTGTLDAGPAWGRGSNSSGPTEPEVEQGTTPLRALGERELENVLADALPTLARQDLTIPTARVAHRYSTFAGGQAVTATTLQLTEGSLTRAASAIAADDTTMGCSVEVEGRACVEAFARRALPRLYRRDATEADVRALGEIFEAQRASDDARTALTTTLAATLLSPRFLYAWSDASGRAVDGRSRLSGFELAERLSFLLWSSSPDDALLDAARTGALSTDTGVRVEATRMMADPRFDRFLVTFFDQWLGLEDVERATKDPTRIPEWHEGLGAQMAEEAHRFVIHWGREDGSLDGLFTSRERFLTPELASFLAVPALGSEDGSARTADDPRTASGIFTLSAFLVMHSRPSSRFGPTLRGHWMRTRLLCGVIGSPPPDALMRAPTEDPAEQTRAWHEQLIANPGCGACHRQMDRLGFSMEHFDGAGRFRTSEVGHAVDSSAEVIGSGDALLDGEYASIIELAGALAGSPVVADCLAQHLTEYALGTDQSRATVAGTVSRRSIAIPLVARDLLGGGLRAALMTLVTSEAFVTAPADEGDRR